MNIPPPLGNEVARGYLGRINRLNGDLPIHILRQRLYDFFRDEDSQVGNRDWAPLLVKASGLSFEKFVREHTFLPFLRTVHPSAGIAHGTSGSQFRMNIASIALPDNCARFCEICIQSDLRSTGTVYWRRHHQLRGVVLCIEHGSVLLQADQAALVRGMPSDVQELAIDIPHNVTEAAQTNDAIRRYAHICGALLNGINPISAKQAATRLAARAAVHGLRISAIGTKKTLSDLTIATVAGPWLAEFFPHLSNKRPGEYIAKFDGTCLSRNTSYHVSSYALALAVLWDCPDDAIDEFRRPLNQVVAPTNSEVFVQENYSTNVILDSTLLPNKTKNQEQILNDALRHFMSGVSLASASEQHGLHPTELEDVLRNLLARAEA